MSISNGSNGDRDHRGQFVKGWRGGPGNPEIRRLATLRAVVTAAVEPKDMMEVMVKLLGLAKAGDMTAIKELFDRTLGPPQAMDLLAQVAEAQSVVRELAALFQQKLSEAQAEIQRLRGLLEQMRQRPALPGPQVVSVPE